MKYNPQVIELLYLDFIRKWAQKFKLFIFVPR